MYLGGSDGQRFRIVEAAMDGGSKKLLYRRYHEKVDFHFNINDLDISILDTELNGTLCDIDVVNGTEKLITSNFSRKNTSTNALLKEVAILQHSREVYALFFWWVFFSNLTRGNECVESKFGDSLTSQYARFHFRRSGRSIVQERDLDIPAGTNVFYLVDREAQPSTANRCGEIVCDHICVLRPDGARCLCDFNYELSDDRRSCESKHGIWWKRRKEAKNESHAAFREAQPPNPIASDSYLTHLMYSVAIVVIIACAVIYFRVRKSL